MSAVTTTRPTPPRVGSKGFTLLEVLIAVAILGMSLTSLLSAQMQAMRATRYAQGVTAATYLAEYQLIEIEFEAKKEGWTEDDQTFEGDFSDQGWPDIRYECLIDFLELPEYGQLTQALNEAEASGDEDSIVPSSQDGVQDAGESALDSMGMVWPMIKGAIESSIRKASCKVMWNDGKVEHDVELSTFWTDPQAMTRIPQLGGQVGEDEEGEDGDGGGVGGGGGGGGAGGGGGGSSSGPNGINGGVFGQQGGGVKRK